MRTTLDIANDVLQAAKVRARREKKTIREVISDLARSALTVPSPATTTPAPKTLYGFRPFPKCGGTVTNDLLDRLREDDVT